ncbi:hypothetical protein A2662_01850 [Candidatus Giovannonibacteria bacterium RIFCSPHIGHO2_01_FULL_45_33]|uniref:Type II secretion system protein GspF domain-containing protein n=1 Tax=Candidatus Wildermuthbacteria bacterium RIFCSPHIGHO2_02_FULL_49_9 TaxID=1802456 RepID=A0A1G2RD13_9BACT|nr:MAG: hypothetical protein A2662_01850 [Candidatus Giovannonibacteria bacterium RIFCSPHIGHO2_01_FULL_45_33]OHA70744.1 MAG: hypothetical protein A3D64_02840 [Candidatus Wildermuthbacteria bacterium RIFCSPHIGHO2_02_FULL_49_9]
MNKRFSLQDQAFFARRLSMLVRSNVPILDALRMMKAQARNKSTGHMFDHMIATTSNGQFLWKGMADYKKSFGDFSVNLVKVGETSGTLTENLIYLADELDKKRELRKKIMSAMLYPAVILAASLGVTGLLTVYLFPKLMPVFQSLNVELPFTTRVLLHTSNFLINYWHYLILGFIAFIIGFIFLLKIQQVRYWFLRVVISLPLIGGFVQDYHLANTCRTLSMLLKSSVRVMEAVNVTANTSSNLLYQIQLAELSKAIARGSNIADHMELSPHLFPPLVHQMVAIGERTGSLSDTLMHLSEIYEKEFDDRNKALTSIMEPALMCIMGLIVGFIAVSIITPIYAVTQNIHP